MGLDQPWPGGGEKWNLTEQQKAYIQEFAERYRTPLTIARARYGGLYSVARGLGIEDGELEQDCWIGVMRAAKRYDLEYRNANCPDRPVKFPTYCGNWIGQMMQRAIHKLQRQNVKTRVGGTVSGDALMSGPSGDRPLWDLIPARDEADRREWVSDLRDRIAEAMSGLPPRVRRIVTMRFGLDGCGPKSLEEIAAEVKVTRERVRQILATSLESMRFPLERFREELLE